MLPLAWRLKRRSEFGRVYSKGRSCATDLIVVYVLPGRDIGTRIGFSVSKKLGKAVARNRVRRLLREAVRQYLPRIRAGYSVIVLARAKAAGASISELSAALGAALARTDILDAGNM